MNVRRTETCATLPYPRRRRPTLLLDLMLGLVKAVARAQAGYRKRRANERLSDETLRDIGLTRAGIPALKKGTAVRRRADPGERS